MYKWFIPLFVVLMALCSCHEDLPSSSVAKWEVSLADEEQQAIVPRLASYESFRVNVKGNEEAATVLVSSSATWLKVMADTLPGDGIVCVETQTNEEATRREAVLTFHNADNPLLSDTLVVTQMSNADNASNGSARESLFVGYGFDIYKNADNQKSVHTLEPIIDCTSLKFYNDNDSYETIHDCKISRTEMKYYTALTISQFSSELTSASTDQKGVTGSLLDCKEALDLCNNSSEKYEQNYGCGVMMKTVASRVMDKGALQDLQRSNKLQYTFSEGFRNAYNKVKKKSGAERMTAIQDLLAKFGTHVITQADLGGKITYMFTMTKSDKADNEAEMKQEIDYTLGTLIESDRNPDYQHQVSSSKNADGAITVIGGEDAAKAQLQADAKTLASGSQLSADHITQWLATINYTDNAANSKNLDVVHFELVPVWDLVESSLRTDFMNATLEMVKRSDCQLPDEMLSTSLYQIDATRKDLVDFDASSTSSLCRTLYLRNGTTMQPVLEVCQEYVPKIRSDKRVTIAYPIYNNRIRLTHGIFLGDEEHCAARVSFGGAKTYVSPISLANGEKTAKTLYYVNGTLYADLPAFTCTDEAERGRVVRDDVLMLRTTEDGKIHKHPIVKVGSAFWTRDNIDHHMNFTEAPNDRDATSRDKMTQDLLYTRFQYDVDFYFNKANSWTYGYSPSTSVEGNPNTKWYLPSPTTLSDLYEYLGFNPKALFKGQCSGFEANFCGYVGYVDVLNAGQDFEDEGNKLRYKDELCIVASRNVDSKQSPSLLVLRPDYSWKKMDDTNLGTEWHRNYYPVKLCRGAYYALHDLATLKAKEE